MNSGTTLNAYLAGSIAGAYTFGNLCPRPAATRFHLGAVTLTFTGTVSDSGTINTVTGAGNYTFSTSRSASTPAGQFIMTANNPTLTFQNGISMNGNTFTTGTGSTTFTTNAQTIERFGRQYDIWNRRGGS